MRFSLRSKVVRVFITAILLLLTYHLFTLRNSTPYPFRFSSSEPGHGRPGYPFPDGPKTPEDHRAVAVIDVFRFTWHGYSQKCFGHDEVRPVTGRCANSRNGWGASLIDALTTALVMGQRDIAEDIINHIPNINFARNGGWPQTVNLFETTIRYLGGLLSSYDLLKNGLNEDYKFDDWQIETLLAQANVLAGKLSYAFDTPSGIPYNRLWLELKTHAPGQKSNSLAAAGSLVLEWQHLSDLLGNTHYQDLVEKVESHILDPKWRTEAPPPEVGLLGTHIDIDNGGFTDTWGSWGGGRDSAYEYMIKMYAYDPNRFQKYGQRWIEAAESTMKHFAAHPHGHDDITFLADWVSQEAIPQSDALAAFAAGNFIFGGSVYGKQEYIDFGLELVNGLHAIQTSTATGIGPETYSWNEAFVPKDQVEFLYQTGFWIRKGVYNTRPEVLESYYYAYRVTNDTKYQDWAWDLFQNINKTCRTEWGLSYVADVNSESPLGGNKIDVQESFVFSEVLKYSYLTFAGDAPWQVLSSGENAFVFNTEGHPLLATHSNPKDDQ